MIQLLFTSGVGPASRLIKWGTRSEWSHIDVVYPGQKAVVGALFFRGVAERSMDDAVRYATKVGYGWLEVPDEVAFWQFLGHQLGKPYDRLAILGFGMAQRNWQAGERWICSELVAGAALAGGKVLQREVLNLIAPRDIWISPALLRVEYA